MITPKSGSAFPNVSIHTFPEGTIYIEIRGIYDGTSVCKLPSGELVNRWPEDDRRHAPTQAWIERMLAKGLGE